MKLQLMKVTANTSQRATGYAYARPHLTVGALPWQE